MGKYEINQDLYLLHWFEKIFILSSVFNILLDFFYLYLNDEYVLFKAALTITKLFKNLLVLIASEIIFKTMGILQIKYTISDY